MKKKLFKIIKFAYLGFAALIALALLFYLCLLILLEYITYNPNYVADYIKHNIQVSVPSIKITRKTHKLALYLYNVKINDEIIIPKAKLKLNVINTLWSRSLIFDNITISKFKFNLNKLSNTISALPEVNANILKAAIIESYFAASLNYLAATLNKFNFFKTINLNHGTVIWQNLNWRIKYLKIGRENQQNLHLYQLRSQGLLIHNALNNFYITLGADFTSKVEEPNNFFGTIYFNSDNFKLKDCKIFNYVINARSHKLQILTRIANNKPTVILAENKSDLNINKNLNVNNLNFNIQAFFNNTVLEKLNIYNLHGDFKDNKTQKSMKVTNAATKINLQTLTGKIDIAKLDVNLRDVINPSLEFKNITSNFNFHKLNVAKHYNINLTNLNANFNDAKINLSGTFAVPKHGFKNTHYQLQSQIDNIDIKTFKTYLPINLMNQAFYNWLDNAFQDGKIVTTKILMFNKQFKAHLQLEDTSFNYVANWPGIKNLQGDIYFHNNNLNFQIKAGKILDYTINSVRGEIKNIASNKTNKLKLQSNLSGDSKNIITFLQSISDDLALDLNFLNAINLDGDSKVNFNLEQDLNPKAQNKFHGLIKLTNNNIMNVYEDINIHNITGTLKFNKHLLKSSKLKLKVFDNDLTLDVKATDDHKFNISTNDFNLSLQNDGNVLYGKVILPNTNLNNILKLNEFLNANFFKNKSPKALQNNLIKKDYYLKLFINNTYKNNDFKIIGTLSQINGKIKLALDTMQVFFDKNLLINFENLKDWLVENLTTNLSSSDFPIEQIFIKKFYVNQNLLGQVELDFTPLVQNFTLNGHLFNLEMTKKNDQVVGNLQVPNIGKLFDFVGYNKIIDKAKMDLSFGFDEINNKNMHGGLFINLKEGVITQIEPGIGRVLGAFSLDTWQRRLKLDFSDLTERNYAFDTILGNINFYKNTFTTKNLLISGPAADVAILGNFDILKDNYNLNVDVIPKISGGVPVAAAIASGNPAIGAIVWALDKLLQSPFNKINRTRYQITGSTQNLEINKVKIS